MTDSKEWCDGDWRWRSSSKPFAGAESGSPGRAVQAETVNVPTDLLFPNVGVNGCMYFGRSIPAGAPEWPPPGKTTADDNCFYTLLGFFLRPICPKR